MLVEFDVGKNDVVRLCGSVCGFLACILLAWLGLQTLSMLSSGVKQFWQTNKQT